MGHLHWQRDREKIREEALERHKRLHKLFVEDRFAFELERKRAIRQVIESAPDPQLKSKLEALQEAWDRKMRHACSPHNRLILAQTVFWDHFFENWLPTIRRANQKLNGKGDAAREIS